MQTFGFYLTFRRYPKFSFQIDIKEENKIDIKRLLLGMRILRGIHEISSDIRL